MFLKGSAVRTAGENLRTTSPLKIETKYFKYQCTHSCVIGDRIAEMNRKTFWHKTKAIKLMEKVCRFVKDGG